MAQNVATAISGVSVSESGNTSGETFTVVVSDTSGVLSANTGSHRRRRDDYVLQRQQDVDHRRHAVPGRRRPHHSEGRREFDEPGYAHRGGDGQLRQQRDEVASGDGDAGDRQAVDLGSGRGDDRGEDHAGAIAGVSITESPTTTGETFTVILSDGAGVLSANTSATGGGGSITPSNSGKTLTIAGTLSQVNADLTTLADTDATTASDAISVTASDSTGGSAGPTSIAVTVNGAPSISAPASATVAQNVATAISGLSVSETGNTSGETFTVVVSDSSGVLSANTGAGGGGTITPSNSNKTLTIVGSLSQVDADLTTLKDAESSTSAWIRLPWLRQTASATPRRSRFR